MKAHWVEVSQLATCKRCGDKNVAWQVSKNGKWYLCAARWNDGIIEADRCAFHQCETRQEKPPVRNSGSTPELLTFMQLIINTGYRALAPKYHPDHGGSTGDMQCLNEAMARLRKDVSS